MCTRLIITARFVKYSLSIVDCVENCSLSVHAKVSRRRQLTNLTQQLKKVISPTKKNSKANIKFLTLVNTLEIFQNTKI